MTRIFISALFMLAPISARADDVCQFMGDMSAEAATLRQQGYSREQVIRHLEAGDEPWLQGIIDGAFEVPIYSDPAERWVAILGAQNGAKDACYEHMIKHR